MVTESDAVLATIVDNWGNGGYGGATPKIQSTTDISVDRWAALDAVIVLHDTLDERHPRVNDKFVNKQYTMDIRVTSITTEDQLKLLVEETEYILNNTAITGFTSVRVGRKNRGSSDRGRKVYRNDVTVNLTAVMSSSAVAPSGGVTTTFETDELTVNTHITGLGLTITQFLDEDNMATDSAAALASQQSIKTYADGLSYTHSDLTDTTLTGAYLEDLLMFGSANAAWVPMPFEMSTIQTKLQAQSNFISNVDGTDVYSTHILPLPTNKGSLKLYITGLRVIVADADATNLVSHTYVLGMKETGGTILLNDGTDRTAQGDYEYAMADTDMSSYDYVVANLFLVVADANALDIGAPLMECFYAT